MTPELQAELLKAAVNGGVGILTLVILWQIIKPFVQPLADYAKTMTERANRAEEDARRERAKSDALEGRVSSLEQQTTDAKTARMQADTLREKAEAQLKAALKTLDKAKSDLEELTVQLQTALRGNDAQKQEIERLMNVIGDQNLKIENLRNDLAAERLARDADKEQANELIESERSQSRELRVTVDKLLKEINESQSRERETAKRAEGLQTQLDDVLSQLVVLRTQVQELQRSGTGELPSIVIEEAQPEPA